MSFHGIVYPALKRRLRKMMKQKLSAFQRRIRYTDFNNPSLAREFQLDPDRQKTGMIATAKRILNITGNEISAMSNELMELYPASIAVYSEECIRTMQGWMKRF